jgi:predicted DNA-binding ribbon-helix-helix protein
MRKSSGLINRNVMVGTHRTSIRLEVEMWVALQDISHREKRSVHELTTLIAGRKRAQTSLTAAIRVFIVAYFRAAATEIGHRAAGHGQGQLACAEGFWQEMGSNAPKPAEPVARLGE